MTNCDDKILDPETSSAYYAENTFVEVPRFEDVRKPFACGMCNRSFSLKGSIKNHILTHTGKTPYCCKECGKSYHCYSSLHQHMRSHGECQCEICGKFFGFEYSLQRHQQIHLGTKPFKCSVCHRAFTLSSHLRRHQVVHKEDKPVKCYITTQCFSSVYHRPGVTPAQIKQHMMDHVGVKAFNCEQCVKSLSKSNPQPKLFKVIPKDGDDKLLNT